MKHSKPRTSSNRPSRITLGVHQDISVVSKLHDRLNRCAARNTDVNLYADRVETIDTATLQLLLSFVREIRARGHAVKWHSPSETVLNTAALIGLHTELIAPRAES